MDLIKHPFNIFPEMLPEDFNRLKSDISANGFDLKYPIYLYEEKILDGWNRQKVCAELKVQPIYKDFSGSQADAISFVMRTNKRRNLTSSQWAAIAVEAEDIINSLKEATEKERREKQAITQSITKGNGAKVELISPQPIEKENNKVRTKLANTFNTNSSYISAAQRLKEIKPEVFEQVKKGEKTLTEVKKEEQKEEKKQKKQFITKELPNDIFNVVYADPPWEYSNSGISGAASDHYATMPTDQIASMKIPSAENSVLFLWVTNPLLEDAFQVIKGWGFSYKTNIVWIKDRSGQGFYVKGQHELLLICTKGSFLPDDSIYVRSIIEEPRQKHSAKPAAVYSIIEKLYPNEKYLELFARSKREGWASYGNEV